MPNIIEQQDLLKNLPDARLATLLQNPVADIPPFLVAAEAQRRQSIRQQFAGSENNESVVDTLTKQIAKVPQNIQPQMQTPPMVPPTPQMQGVAALQQQQAIQDIAQQAQPQQQMRHGGMVQRYYDGGKVKPWWEIPDISSTFSGAGSYIGSKVSELADWATKPYAERKAEEEAAAKEVDNFDVTLPDIPVGGTDKTDPTVSDVFTSAKKKKEEAPAATSEPPPPPQPGETKDEYRARLEEFYANLGVSDWEKAQKWFAMAEQFLDPSKTTMQSIAGAGRAFAEAAGEQSRQQREAELAGKKALLEYDIAKTKENEEKALLAEEKKAAAQKARTDIATGQLDDLRRERRDIAQEINRIQTAAVTGMNGMTPEMQAQIDALRQSYDDLGSQIATYEKYVTETYGFPRLPQADISGGKIIPPRT